MQLVLLTSEWRGSLRLWEAYLKTCFKYRSLQNEGNFMKLGYIHILNLSDILITFFFVFRYSLFFILSCKRS